MKEEVWAFLSILGLLVCFFVCMYKGFVGWFVGLFGSGE